MIRLKHVLGTNVSHSVLSHIPKRQYSHPRLLQTSQFNACRPKTVTNVRNIDSAGHRKTGLNNNLQHRRPKSGAIKKISSKRILPQEKTQERRKSAYQLARTKEKSFEQCTSHTENLRNTVTKMADAEVKSYARMIARYTEAMYSKPSIVALKDSNSVVANSRISRSPFSTTSVVSIKPFRSVSPNRLIQDANFSTETSAMRCESRNLGKGFVGAISGNEIDIERTSSYATMIEKYSNAANIPSYDVATAIPRRHVSTGLEDVSKKFETTKRVGGRSEEIVEGSKKGDFDDQTEPKKSDTTEKRDDTQSDWMKDEINDPKRIMANDTNAKMFNDLTLQAASQQAYWLDKVVEAHRKKKIDRKLAPARTLKTTDGTVTQVSLQSDAKQAGIGSIEVSGNKPSNPIAEYIKRGPSSGSRNPQSPTKNSTQPTAASGSAKQPQIELRMTPTHNESVVAINVDELSAKATGANDHLSVVISSKKNNVADRPNLESRPDFGSMQISISEDTVPVKQIEFSINGKPVSELKSILARTDKLDVLSSMDKVEIRIPSKGNGRAANQQDVAKATPNPSAILNLHINAKFNEPRMERPAGVTPEATPGTGSAPIQAPVPPRSQNILPPRGQGVKSISSSSNTVNVARFEESIVDQEANVSTSEVSTSRNKEAHKADNDSSREMLKYSNERENVENREPSNIIPWWSSEGSFNKIKKKEITKEPSETAVPPEEMRPVTEESKSSNALLKTESSSQSKNVNPNNTTEHSKNATPEDNKDTGESAFQPKTAASSNPVESSKANSPKSLVEKLEVNEKPTELPEANTVQVKSPQRWAPAKPANIMKAPKPAKQIRLIKKNTKYRTRNVKTPPSPKRSSDTSINSVPPPEAVTFVAVHPKTIHMEPEPKKADEKQRKVEGETKKLGAGETVRPTDETVQNSDTVYEGADLEKSANRSAGVSVKTPSAAGESGSEHGKGRAEGKTAGTVGKVLPGSDEHAVDRRMREILKTMKPIEKRKDGTLIDYGVKVLSRKPPKKVQTRPNKVPVNVNVKKVASVASEEPETIAKMTKKVDSKEIPVAPSQSEVNRTGKMSSAMKERSKQENLVDENAKSGKKGAEKRRTSEEKIVEPLMVSSVKKDTLTEPKTVTAQPKIVEPVKISSVKKNYDDMPTKPTIHKPVKTLSQRQLIRSEPKHVPYQPRLGAGHVYPSRVSSATANIEGRNLMESQQEQLLAKKLEKKLLQNRGTSSSDPRKTVEYRTRNYEPSKGQNIADSVKSKEKNPAKSISEQPERKKPAISSNEPEKEAMTHNSETTAKRMQKDARPQKSNVEVKKNETKSSANSKSLKKETGAAPFEGTINFSTFSEEKRGKQKKTKMELSGDEEPSGFDGRTVGPAGLNPMGSSMIKSKISTDQVNTLVASSMEGKKISEEDKIKMFKQKLRIQSKEAERPEKGLLYASWLQRFRGSVDDDKIM